MVPDFRRDDIWMPPYQARGMLLKSDMTENAVYGQTLNNNPVKIDTKAMKWEAHATAFQCNS
jgi:hypothetical protein